MGSYLDTTDAEIIALTRQRRAEAIARKPEMITIRLRGFGGVEFDFTCERVAAKASRRRTSYKSFKAREWKAGRRHCAYCGIHMTRKMNRLDTMTLDHRHPLALGGADDASNWVVACMGCNRRKAAMTEAEFRALLAPD